MTRSLNQGFPVMCSRRTDQTSWMTLPRAARWLPVAVLGLVLAACGGDSAVPGGDPSAAATTSVPSSATPRAVAGLQLGTAGLIPRNFPSSEADDWIAMYEASAETGPLLGVYGGWTDANTPAGRAPDVFEAAYAAADRFGGFTPVIGLGFATENILTGVMQPTVDWTDPAEVEAFTTVAVAIAETHEPGFMVGGAEINRIWEQHPANYEAFVAAWPALYEAIKAVSPDTVLGTAFQYEFLRGAGYLSGQTRAPQWDLLDAFRQHSDFVAFSSYPYFDFETPGAVPTGYYSDAAERAGLPIAFTELGWPSRPLSTFPESGYGGSEAEQTVFAQRFLELIDGLDVRFALWSFQHDLGEPGGPAFESIALRENDGTPKPVLEVWAAASK